MLSTSQNYLQILESLLSTRPPHERESSSPAASDHIFPEPLSMQPRSRQISQVNPSFPADVTVAVLLPAPIALTVTSIFAQLISLYELILEYLTARVERIAIDPIAPIPGLIYGGVTLENSGTQGVLFTEAIVYLLEKIEYTLGIKSGPGATHVTLLFAVGETEKGALE